jgi:hypothetical protein
MKDGTTPPACKPEHAVVLDTEAVVWAEITPVDEGDTTTLPGTLETAATLSQRTRERPEAHPDPRRRPQPRACAAPADRRRHPERRRRPQPRACAAPADRRRHPERRRRPRAAVAALDVRRERPGHRPSRRRSPRAAKTTAAFSSSPSPPSLHDRDAASSMDWQRRIDGPSRRLDHLLRPPRPSRPRSDQLPGPNMRVHFSSASQDNSATRRRCPTALDAHRPG